MNFSRAQFINKPCDPQALQVLQEKVEGRGSWEAEATRQAQIPQVHSLSRRPPDAPRAPRSSTPVHNAEPGLSWAPRALPRAAGGRLTRVLGTPNALIENLCHAKSRRRRNAAGIHKSGTRGRTATVIDSSMTP